MNSGKEIHFLRTYKDFIYYFNLLERNIGYCLRSCSALTNQENPDKWLTASFDLKVKKIISLAKSNALETVFHKWHSKVQKCRHLRNIIAHGQWEWKEWQEKPIYYHSPEIADGEGSFTTEGFRLKLIFLQDAFESFHEIRTPLEISCAKSAQPDAPDKADKSDV